MSVEASFEAKFAQMANATLAERVPSLQDEHVGFQLIDKADDETRAVGVSAYIVNNLYCYIPVFFINGELKGMELLYIFQRDVFVPADDSYISMLKQEGINALGKPADSNDSRNPTDFFYAPEDVSTPEYEGRFTYKTASKYIHLSLQRAFDKLAVDKNSHIPLEEFKMMSAIPNKKFEDIYNDSMFKLAEDIPALGKTAAYTFVHTILKEPEFANAMLRNYTLDEMGELMKTAAAATDVGELIVKDGDKDVDNVTFMTSNATGDMPVLANKEKKLLIENGLYIKDERTNFSKIYQDQIDTGVYQNPTAPGIYDVMMYDGSTERYLILFPSDLSAESMYTRQWNHQNVDCVVALIKVGETKKYHNVQAKLVFCKPSTGITNQQIEMLQKGQDANLRNLSRLRKQNANEFTKIFTGHILLVQSPTCSFQTKFVESEGSRGEVRLKRTAGEPNVDRNYWRDNPATPLCAHFVDQEGVLNTYDSSMIIPDGTKVYTEETDNVIELGAPKIVGLRFAKEAAAMGMSRLGITVKGSLASIEFKDEHSPMIDKIAVIKYLTLAHKIEGSQAIQLIKEAAECKHGRKYFKVIHASDAAIFDKNAQSGINDMSAYGDSVNPPWNGGPRGRRETAVNYKTHINKGRALTGPVDADGQSTLPQDVIGRAMDASNAGITEVFNVEVMRGLIDVADISQLKKGFLAKMVKGMDSTGRMLFLYYWHQDKFEETYGLNETQKLEQTLRNVFQSMGDLILFLREKSTYNDAYSENLFGNLSEDIGTAAAM